jgi:hypothetical protein
MPSCEAMSIIRGECSRVTRDLYRDCHQFELCDRIVALSEGWGAVGSQV